MPRNPDNKNEFIAGVLPTVKIKSKTYYVDGRLEELRNVKNFMDKIYCVDDNIWNLLTKKDKKTIIFEFLGEEI